MIAPCHFGLEAVLKKEIYDLGYDIANVSDGRVTFIGDAEAIAMANVRLRTAERILLETGSFHAETFEEFFEGIRAIPWEKYIPEDGRFWVTKVSSVKSKLFSAPDMQSLAKKAMVERLKETYHTTWFSEEGSDYPVRIFLMKNEVTVALDTTGVPLHKRGYRTMTARAPLSETLAAALLDLTFWKAGRILTDPFSGSGTFLIEAAMKAAHIAPGVKRSFTAEQWPNLVESGLWKDVREEAKAEELPLESGMFWGSDIDDEMVRIAKINAKQAGVGKAIRFTKAGVADFVSRQSYGIMITNPPYGERLADKEELPELYRTLGKVYRNLDAWSLYVITAYRDAPKQIGKRADKNRKIYNGMLQTYFYQFLGPKPGAKHE